MEIEREGGGVGREQKGDVRKKGESE